MSSRYPFLLWITALISLQVGLAEGAVTRVTAGQTVTFQASVVGDSPVFYRWYRGDKALEGKFNSTLVLEKVTALEAGAYSVVAYNSAGAVQSEKVMIEVVGSVAAPVLADWPSAVTANLGESTTLSIQATGSGTLTYQWYRNGTALLGETGPQLSLSNLSAAQGGIYTVSVSNDSGTTTSRGLNLILNTPRPSRLTNFSIRSWTRGVETPLIVGFGVSSPRPMPLLVRGAGPSLTALGVSQAIADPRLTVFEDQFEEARNDDWGETGVAHLYAQLFQAIGAFPYTSEASLDSALLLNLQGSRTIHLYSNRNSAPGVALFEAYDLVRAADGLLINLSAQNLAGKDSSTLILGFVIEGESPLPLLIRGVGPSLQKFGVADWMADPLLVIYQGDKEVARNDNWGSSAALTAFEGTAGAFPLLNGSKDAALLLSLPPGSYTAHVSTVANQEARALVEIYAPAAK